MATGAGSRAYLPLAFPGICCPAESVVCLPTAPHPQVHLKVPSGRGPMGSARAYCDAGGGAGADAVHFGEGLRGAEALALAAAQGLPVGFGQVPGLLLLVASVQLVQGVFHLLHHCLMVILQA